MASETEVRANAPPLSEACSLQIVVTAETSIPNPPLPPKGRTQRAPGKATDWKVAGDEPAPLREWLPRAKNRSRRHVRKTLSGPATIDEAKTGHPLVDPEG